MNERAAALWQAGERWDAILAVLRAEGFSKIDCVKATVDQLRLPLGEAKRIVHDSDAWADIRDSDEAWHDSLATEVEAGAGLGG
ncbi:MAG TPA: hypothetical protein VFJ85_15240 [Acidimicrobiales bacterium]|nr:hypothetical protein [Acidimicrobiales bacterium]